MLEWPFISFRIWGELLCLQSSVLIYEAEIIEYLLQKVIVKMKEQCK